MVSIPSFTGAAALGHLGVIRARGADAASFLQAQLTNDVAALDGVHGRVAGFCSAKGRLQASFWVVRPAADEVLLVCAADLLPATLKRLSMFVLRAKCKLDDASAELALHGIVSADGAASLPSSAAALGERQFGATDWGVTLRLPDAAGHQRYLVFGKPAGAEMPALALDAWRWLDLHSGVPLISAATVDQFVPQMVNFELVGGVDFKKGCYPGQEVVARSQYRGTVKRRMFLFDATVDQSAAAPSPGAELFAPNDAAQPAGLVVDAAPNPNGGWSLLAEAKLAAVDGPGLRLGSADGPTLNPRELAYEVPREAIEVP